MIRLRFIFRRVGRWLLAGAGSLALTLALFGLLPALLQDVPDKAPVPGVLAAVEVSRPALEKTPPPAGQREPEPEPDKAPPVPTPAPEPLPLASAIPALTLLSAEINPDMPSLPVSLAPGSLQSVGVGAPQALAAAPSVGSPSLSQGVSTGLYQAGEIDGPLTPMGNMDPVYPLKAKRRNIQGKVMVEFVVGVAGTVEDLKIVDYVPPEIAGVFDQSVVQAVSAWRFAPGTLEGRPVRTLTRAPIEFILE